MKSKQIIQWAVILTNFFEILNGLIFVLGTLMVAITGYSCFTIFNRVEQDALKLPLNISTSSPEQVAQIVKDLGSQGQSINLLEFFQSNALHSYAFYAFIVATLGSFMIYFLFFRELSLVLREWQKPQSIRSKISIRLNRMIRLLLIGVFIDAARIFVTQQSIAVQKALAIGSNNRALNPSPDIPFDMRWTSFLYPNPHASIALLIAILLWGWLQISREHQNLSSEINVLKNENSLTI